MAKAPDVADEGIAVMMTTNVTALVNMTQAMLPIFQARPDGSSDEIINIESVAGKDAGASDGDGAALLTDVWP